jgi:hypothetical protein
VTVGFNDWSAHRGRALPTEAEWMEFTTEHPVGSIVSGVVLSVHPFGVFLALDQNPKITGLLELPFDDPATRDGAEYRPVGSRVPRAAILRFSVFPKPEVYLGTRAKDLGGARS